MVWGDTSVFDISDDAMIILGYNEPNHKNQAKITAERAAAAWLYLTQELKKSNPQRLFVSPSAAPCNGDKCLDNRDDWFREFFRICRRDGCQIDFLATHIYSCKAAQVVRQMKALYEEYGLKIWLTEFACGDLTDEIQMLNFMKDILPQLEAADYIYSYSWYKARVSTDHYVKKAASLLDPSGSTTLTPLGVFYNGFEGTARVDGVWGEWGAWNLCGLSCGGGHRSRSRKCVYPDPSAKTFPCIGIDTEKMNCNTDACPTNDGVWGDWGTWSTCRVTCGEGQRSRSRTCIYSDLAEQGAPCTGSETEAENCNTQTCPVDGVWEDWGQWSSCEVTCGGGESSRSRTCMYSDSANRGEPCAGPDTEVETCNTQICPDDGVWGDWGTWSTCRVTCGEGQRSRSRTCIYSDLAEKGAPCTGSETEAENCNTQTCPVDGVWEDWGQWSTCEVTCGGGESSRSRTCIYSDSANLGERCAGLDTEVETCNTQTCPVDGVWEEWEQWSTCERTCGGGQRSRSRTCAYSDLLNSGKPCAGLETETETCNTQACPVDGIWEDWGHWSTCEVTCGEGQRSRSRACIYFDSSNERARCSGPETEIEDCSTQACPVDGVWEDWGHWSTCEQTCGGGQRSRSRSCVYSDSANAGASCAGSDTDSETCNTQACPVNGVWGYWEQWRACEVTCGWGQRSRSRRCIYPDLENAGESCAGSDTDAEICSTEACPVDGVWGDWGQWSSCGVTCGWGKRSRSRTCIYSDSGNPGAPCAGLKTESEICNTQSCPVGGVWTKWSRWSKCSAKCGKGKKKRKRTCIFSGKNGNNCNGSAKETRTCFGVNCKVGGVWTKWSRWSKCSAICGKGKRKRKRTCIFSSKNGNNCNGSAKETKTCFGVNCKVGGVWTKWSRWSKCSVRCGKGKKKRKRICIFSGKNGNNCNGSAKETRTCFGVNCKVGGVWT